MLEHNREVLYHLSPKYEYIHKYLVGSLRETLFSILRYFSNKEVIIQKHRYIFFADNKRLTYGIRKKSGESTTNRYVNLLCAMGFFTKQKQTESSENIIKANENFKRDNPQIKRFINVYSFRKYDDKELKRIEERSERLWNSGVTTGNFSFNMLALHGLMDLAKEALPINNWDSPQRKVEEYLELITLLDLLIDSQGYATRQQIEDNLLIGDQEIKNLLRISKRDLESLYCYKRPTGEQIKKFGLTTKKYIYTKREGK